VRTALKPLRQHEKMKRSLILSKHSLVGPTFRYGLDAVADLPITALLRERVHTLRLSAAILSFFRHGANPRDGGSNDHPLTRGAGRELILGVFDAVPFAWVRPFRD
jgi:hypothetical protein